ncbi:MAG: GNAT family N-acetyltransferase [Rhodobacterales bacterium]|nr:MAG: GNAT family N-acetyltransferase [Rhodobacterales bacterium]
MAEFSVGREVEQPPIQAERFVLRAPRPSDIGLMEHYGAEKRMAQASQSIPHPLPPGFVANQIARVLEPERTEDVWVLDGHAAGGDAGQEVLGAISLTHLDRAQSQLAFWIAPPFWNMGFAQEAVQVLVEANPLGNDMLFAEVFQDNPASARVLTNAGFDYMGDAEAYSVARDATVPTWTYIRKMSVK